MTQLDKHLASGAYPLLVFCSGFVQWLITQTYFEGDPLIAICPIVRKIPDPDTIDRLVAPLDLNAAVPLDCLAYKFDIVLRAPFDLFSRTAPRGTAP